MPWARIEGPAYWICFVAMFFAVAIWESFKPKRELSTPAERRWRNHGAMFVIFAAITAVILRFNPVILALAVADSRWGVLNKPWLPLAVRCGITVVLLDLLQYWIHWSFHHVGWLWRIHQVHHFRPRLRRFDRRAFPPARSAVLTRDSFRRNRSAGDPAARSPDRGTADRDPEFIRTRERVTAGESRTRAACPVDYRIHHSQEIEDQNRNLGQTFSWWDRFFGTYASAAAGEGSCRTGLRGLDGCDSLGIGFMLAEPFRKARQEDPEASPDPLTGVRN